MRILVTGSRFWEDKQTIHDALEKQRELAAGRSMVVVQGGARGADRIASQWARRNGAKTECHVADWQKHGSRAGIIRNQNMVDRGADVCLAFPLGESRGTRHCMEAAMAAGIPVVEYEDDEE